VLIRFGLLGERLPLIELQRRASLAWDDYRDALMANPDAIDLPLIQLEDNCVRVAEVEGKTAGFSVVLAPADGTAELDGLFVEPPLWGSGIGRALVGDAVALARSRGARVMEVTAGPRALGFYEKMGFTRLGEAQTRFGPAIRMRRPIR
jgi:GNAT superfamily N-acetyltransferase